MAVAWRISKVRYHPFDGAGAREHGARWNSPGREVIYAADTFAGAILEKLAHSLRPRTLPGRHHAVRVEFPDDVMEVLDPGAVPGWDDPESNPARRFGDEWLAAERSAVLSVPALPARPIGRTLMINPHHADAGSLLVSDPFPVPWDERLF